MNLFTNISRLYDHIENRRLSELWNSGMQIMNTSSVKYVDSLESPVVIKRTKSIRDFKDHISFYREVLKKKIRTPKILSKDKRNLMIEYQAIGIEHGQEKVWSKTLVNFRYYSDKEEGNIEFLVRVMEYALIQQWTDLHSANILFYNGYLYLIDYVPGIGTHRIGSFGLEAINSHEKMSLKQQGFDRLLEKALSKFSRDEISYYGLDFLRS